MERTPALLIRTYPRDRDKPNSAKTIDDKQRFRHALSRALSRAAPIIQAPRARSVGITGGLREQDPDGGYRCCDEWSTFSEILSVRVDQHVARQATVTPSDPKQIAIARANERLFH